MIPVNICCPNGQPTHVPPSHFDVTGARGYHFRVCRAADKIQQAMALLEEAAELPGEAAPQPGWVSAYQLHESLEFLHRALLHVTAIHDLYYDVVDAPQPEGVE